MAFNPLISREVKNMNDKQFKNIYGKKKGKKPKVKGIRYKIVTRDKGIWNIPEKF